MEKLKEMINMFREYPFAVNGARFVMTIVLTVLMYALSMPLPWKMALLAAAAAINYKMFLDCAAALSSKKADENLLPSLAVILSAAALAPGCGGAVLAAVSLSGLAADLIAPEKKKDSCRGFRPKGRWALIFAGAGLVVLLAWMIVTGVNGSIQWKQGLLHGAALMAAVCGADLVCEKKLAFRKALRQIRETGTKLRGSSDDDGTEEIVKNIGKADTFILEQKNIVTLDERIVTEIWTFSHMDEQHILHLFNTAEDNRKGPAGKRIEISENGTRYIIGKPTQIKGAPRKDGHWPKAAEQADMIRRMGRIPVLICDNEKILGMVSVEEKLNPTAAEAMTMIGAMGIGTVMFSENDRLTADSVGRKAGIGTVYSGQSRSSKRSLMADLEAQGKTVAFMGETPKAVIGMGAQVSMAIGPGGAADAEVPDNDLLRIEKLFKAGRKMAEKLKRVKRLSEIYDAAAALMLTGIMYLVSGSGTDPLTGSLAFTGFIVIRLALSFW